MDKLLACLKGTFAYLDDLVISSRTEQDHYLDIVEVFRRLNDFGLCIRIKKCKFFVKKIEFLRHIVDANGIASNPERVAAIQNMPGPKNVLELSSYLNALNYY